MNAKLATTIRHALTAIPALGAYLLSMGWLMPAEAAEVDALQVNLVAGLAAVLGAVAGRLLLAAIAKWAPGLKGVFGFDSSGRGAGLMAWIAWPALVGGLALVTCAGLSGCSGFFEGLPEGVNIGLRYRDPDSGAKGGLVLTHEGALLTGSYKVLDEAGEVIGTADVSIPIVRPEK